MPTKKTIFKILKLTLFLVILIILFIAANEYKLEKEAHFIPDYEKTDLYSEYKDGIKEEDYRDLFFQTGLGEKALKNILENSKNPIEILEQQQENFFEKILYKCDKITIITGEEKNINQSGAVSRNIKIQDMRDGDILISFSTHSLGWRHGHSAIVVDSKTGMTLEAAVLGRDSEFQSSKNWESYPTFVQLRLNDEALEKIDITREDAEASLKKVANEKLLGVPYGLLTGLPIKYIENIKKTQCSHLVWYAYKELGIDIDQDGGWLVTPKDMVNSDYFDVVQIYGLNPKEYIRDNN